MTLCSFADHRMTIAQNRLHNSFLDNGGTAELKYNEGCYTESFRNKNKDILSQERGAGYWLWKPYIIMDALNKINEGEWLLYVDSGIELLSDLNMLTGLGLDIVLFHNEWRHVDWCKMDVLNAMLPNWRNYRQKKQLQASIILLKNSERVKQLVREWLEWCQEPRFIDDSPSRLRNVFSFREHRHDQSILSCLAIRYNIPTQDWYKYTKYFIHHRLRNHEWRPKNTVC